VNKLLSVEGGPLVNKQLRIRLFANDQLLKALTTLLAIRDPDLLRELRTIFQIAAARNNEIGNASQETWTHLEEELDLIAQLAGVGKH
jgi:hypothetical protein